MPQGGKGVIRKEILGLGKYNEAAAQPRSFPAVQSADDGQGPVRLHCQTWLRTRPSSYCPSFVLLQDKCEGHSSRYGVIIPQPVSFAFHCKAGGKPHAVFADPCMVWPVVAHKDLIEIR